MVPGQRYRTFQWSVNDDHKGMMISKGKQKNVGINLLQPPEKKNPLHMKSHGIKLEVLR